MKANIVSSALLPWPSQLLEGEFIVFFVFIFRLFFDFRDIFFIEIDIALFAFFFSEFDFVAGFQHLSWFLGDK